MGCGSGGDGGEVGAGEAGVGGRGEQEEVGIAAEGSGAQGEVIDEAAMANMLADGALGGAGLDVFEHEPAINAKLLKLANVVLLPHMSSATVEGRIEMGEKVMINIKAFQDGHKPPDRVIPSML